jgi:hypothetical protein
MEDKGFSEEEESTRHEEESPEWLLTNLAERKRQMKVLKEKHRKENQTSYEQMKALMAKSTG